MERATKCHSGQLLVRINVLSKLDPCGLQVLRLPGGTMPKGPKWNYTLHIEPEGSLLQKHDRRVKLVSRCIKASDYRLRREYNANRHWLQRGRDGGVEEVAEVLGRSGGFVRHPWVLSRAMARAPDV